MTERAQDCPPQDYHVANPEVGNPEIYLHKSVLHDRACLDIQMLWSLLLFLAKITLRRSLALSQSNFGINSNFWNQIFSHSAQL